MMRSLNAPYKEYARRILSRTDCLKEETWMSLIWKRGFSKGLLRNFQPAHSSAILGQFERERSGKMPRSMSDRRLLRSSGGPRLGLQDSFSYGGIRLFHSSRQRLEKRADESKQSLAQSLSDQSESKKQDHDDSSSPWQRPTKDELLARASGMFERLRIRTKWLLLKQVRPFNTDDISAFFSWFLVGNLVWILLGTTTFFSLVLLMLNSVSAQDFMAGWIGTLVTRETGMHVVFEHAIVPKWKDGAISFRKVFVSRRPGLIHNRVKKGSQTVAAAAARATHTHLFSDDSDEDGNYTQFDLTIDEVSVTLSLRRWIDGRGILKDVEVKGLRGVVDRSHLKWDDGFDPTEHRNVHKKGDFELDSFKMEDALFTLCQPGGAEPFDVSIFNCDLPQLRKHWLFYDFLSANNMSGSYDNSLFTIHPRQMTVIDNDGTSSFKKVNRLRIDGVNIKHLNRGVDGPFSWIQSGNVDFLADVMLPPDSEEFKLSEVVQDIVERWEANILSRQQGTEDIVTSVEERAKERQAHKYVVVDLRVQLNNTRAAVPLFTSDLTYINNALIRPIVAYINSRDTYIPINCRVVKKLNDFEGSWTMYDSRLMDDVSAEVYEAFAQNVADHEARARRMRKVGLWSLQFATQILLLSLGFIA